MHPTSAYEKSRISMNYETENNIQRGLTRCLPSFSPLATNTKDPLFSAFPCGLPVCLQFTPPPPLSKQRPNVKPRHTSYLPGAGRLRIMS